MAPDEVDQHVLKFLFEVNQTAKRYGLSISHEDTGGGFVVEPYSRDREEWLAQAATDPKTYAALIHGVPNHAGFIEPPGGGR